MSTPDPLQRAQLSASEKIERMKSNPEATIFGQFEGRSRSGRVTIWVDVLGRPQRFRIAPNSLQEGDEAQLIRELTEASAEAQKSANLLDFNMAELAHELSSAVSSASPEESNTGSSPEIPNHSSNPVRPCNDDWGDWEDSNENRSFLQ